MCKVSLENIGDEKLKKMHVLIVFSHHMVALKRAGQLRHGVDEIIVRFKIYSVM